MVNMKIENSTISRNVLASGVFCGDQEFNAFIQPEKK